MVSIDPSSPSMGSLILPLSVKDFEDEPLTTTLSKEIVAYFESILSRVTFPEFIRPSKRILLERALVTFKTSLKSLPSE